MNFNMIKRYLCKRWHPGVSGARDHWGRGPWVASIRPRDKVLLRSIGDVAMQVQRRSHSALLRYCVRLVAVMVLGLGFHATSHAASQCAASSGLPGPLSFTPNVAVPANLQTWATIPGTPRNFTITGVCALGKGTPNTIQAGSQIVACTLNTGSVEISPGIYTTTVNGVGMRLRDSAGNPVLNGSGQNCYSVISQIGAGGAFSFSGTYELVRVPGTIANGAVLSGGPTGAGAWAFGVYNTNIVLNADRGNIYSGNSSIYPTGDITLRNISCTVMAPSTVTLPTVSASSLAVGQGSGAKNFSIGLTCDNDSVVGITLDAAPGITIVDASHGILGLQGTSSATGIGVQILEENGSVVPMQARNDFGSVRANVTFVHPYYARYIRVGSVSAGSVNSAMVFTMDYQ